VLIPILIFSTISTNKGPDKAVANGRPDGIPPDFPSLDCEPSNEPAGRMENKKRPSEPTLEQNIMIRIESKYRRGMVWFPVYRPGLEARSIAIGLGKRCSIFVASAKTHNVT
jgi:hypothetical protein